MLRVWIGVLIALGAALAACSGPADAPDLRVAVATNFLPAMAPLTAKFEADTGYELQIVSGSTGALYTHITQGAPFDVFLAADQARPEKLEADGRAVQGSQVTYALGQLVLWSRTEMTLNAQTLQQASIRNLAIANPELAPYGRAAREVLMSEGVYEKLREKLVFGENIGQTFALVETGNAEFGFVAKAQLVLLSGAKQGSYWMPPTSTYTAIRQDAVLLTRAGDNPAAKAFLDFLTSEDARQIIAPLGFDLP